MKTAALTLALTTLFVAATASAEVDVSVQIGNPPPPRRVIVSTPPFVRFETAPLFIAPARLGFYVGVDTPYDIVFSSDFFYLYYGNSWHRSSHHNGPWVEMPYRDLPPAIRKQRIEKIRSYRDREYREYRNDRDHYRGRYFRPGQERRQEIKEERRHDKEEWKDERRRDKEEWQEEKRRDKDERKEEKHEQKQHGHGRD
jgi:hypothetical protein